MKFLHDIKMIMTTSCDRASGLLSKSQETSLSRSERTALRLHLWICHSCRRYQKQLDLLRALFKQAAQKSRDIPRRPMSPEQRKRIFTYLKKHL